MTVDGNLPNFSTLRVAFGRDLHFFRRNEQWIAFGRVSGVILSLQEIEASILQDFIKGGDIRDICQKRSIPAEQCLSILRETAVHIRDRRVAEEKLQPIKSFLMIITEACNMACTYCYGRFGQNSGIFRWMSPATARRTVEVARELGAGEIAFFGGEPLLNFTAVKETVRYAEELGLKMKYGMTTNGTLVTEEIANFCQRHNIRVSVSVDGPEEVHNLTRRYSNGSTTFTDVKRGIERLQRRGLLDFIEATYSMKHPVNLKDTINKLRSYCERVTVTCVEGPADAAYQDEIVKGTRLKKYYADMLDILLEEPQSSTSYVSGVRELVDILVSPLTVHRPYICSGVMRRATVAPDGRLYPCPETMEDRFCFGSVWDNRLVERLEEERKRVLQSLSKRENNLEGYWFMNLVDTCIVRISRDKSGVPILDDASTFEECLEDLIARIIQMDPHKFRIDAVA